MSLLSNDYIQARSQADWLNGELQFALQRASSPAASKILKDLVDLKILREVTLGREKVFVNDSLLNLLTRDKATTA